MNFRPRIKELLKEKGILQKTLAEKLGISPEGLSQTLKGAYPQLQTLERIASALDVRVADLFDRPSAEIVCPKCGAKIAVDVKVK